MSGNSGIKQTRTLDGGTRPYMSQSHTGKSVASIHDHASNIRTVGMGEIVAVLNGVEFRTRHNDYQLAMPSRFSTDYQTIEDVPFPEVPPQVLEKSGIKEQIVEMQQWFKAWKEQNSTVRDYRQYFKPILCYLEGYWTHSNGKVEEPFFSDRHMLDAKTWYELQERERFISASGRKDPLENYAFLPTAILDMVNGTVPLFGQWNYRILCHPLRNDLPLDRFRVADELNARMRRKKELNEHENTRAARFELNPLDNSRWKDAIFKKSYLDELMNEIPGLDNYPAYLNDYSFGSVAADYTDTKPLNAAYYHRWFRAGKVDAMGELVHHRGFSDTSVYMAMNTQEKIAAFKSSFCEKKHHRNGCMSSETISQRWSYAIPLEIIYLTPLYKWNPYDIEYKGDASSSRGHSVTAGGRNGKPSLSRAFNGVNSKHYYLTPAEFYTSGEVHTDKADTSGENVAVLDRSGEVKLVRASGTRIFLPNIPNVGVLRTRYPIMPVHAHGQAVWKELAALKDIVMRSHTYGRMFAEPPYAASDQPTGGTVEKNLLLVTGVSNSAVVDPHVHEFELTPDEVVAAKLGKSIFITSSIDNGHSHNVELRFSYYEDDPSTGFFFMWTCDEESTCRDKHKKILRVRL